MTIKLTDIIPCAWNPRGKISPASITDLVRSIGEIGLVHLITVWREADTDPWTCIAGCRRLAALNELGKAETEATVFVGTRNQAMLVTVAENRIRHGVGVIAEANTVAECESAGMDIASISSALGETMSWVRRRKKILALDDSWKDRADRISVDVLEKIAALPPDVQKRVAKNTPNHYSAWSEIHYIVDREMRTLESAIFDTSACRECYDRTGAEADLFGVCDGKLGQCMNAACFVKKIEEHMAAEIARLTEGAVKVVRVTYFNLPGEHESSKKRTKKYTCAYVSVNDYSHDITVRWAKTPEAREAEQEAKNAAELEAEKAQEEAVNRSEEIKRKLEAAFVLDGEEYPDALAAWLKTLMSDRLTEDQREYIAGAIHDKITDWHNNYDWADIVRTFDTLPALAGVSDEDAAWYVARYERHENNEEE